MTSLIKARIPYASQAMIAAHAATVARRAAPYGIYTEIAPEKTGKKYLARMPDGRHAFFGQRGAEDYISHGNEARRARYRARAAGVIRKDGRRAIDVFGSPAWLSYWLLW
jgi:hypothetical protein